MAVGDFAVFEDDFVMGELVVILVGFDANEGEGEQNGTGVEEFEPVELVHLAGGPGHHGRDARGDQDQRVERAYRNIQPAVRPVAFQ